MTTPKHQSSLPFTALLIVTVIWASTFALTKMVLEYMPPLLLLAVRFTMAFAALFVLFPRRFIRHCRSSLRTGTLIGILLAISYMTQTIGIRYTTASKASFITGLSVILVPLLGALLYRRLPSFRVMLGTLSAVIGLALVSGVLDDGLAFNQGDWWVLACAVTSAMVIIAVGHWAKHSEVTSFAMVQMAVVAISCWGMGLSLEVWPAHIPLDRWLMIIFLALMATGAALLLQNWAQQHVSPSSAAIVMALEPVFAAAIGFVVLRERLSIAGYAGCAFIVAGMVIAELKPMSSRKVQTPMASSPSLGEMNN